MSHQTRDVHLTILARIQREPAYAQALWNEAVQLFLEGEPDTAKLILRDLVNATVGFEELAERIQKPSKSVHRMLSASGNPTMDNLSAIFSAVKPVLMKAGPRQAAA
jgi:DNA-binding phage protein